MSGIISGSVTLCEYDSVYSTWYHHPVLPNTRTFKQGEAHCYFNITQVAIALAPYHFNSNFNKFLKIIFQNSI